jgi:hypothetical protein
MGKIPITDFDVWIKQHSEIWNYRKQDNAPECIPICVPSYKNRKAALSLHQLENCANTLNRKVYIYVNKDDFHNYEGKYKNVEFIIYDGIFGRPFIRNYIVDHQYNILHNNRIFLIDDDIECGLYYFKSDKDYNSKIKVNLYQTCKIIEDTAFTYDVKKGNDGPVLGKAWDVSPAIGLHFYCQFFNFQNHPAFVYNSFPNKFYYLNLKVLHDINVNFEKSDLFPDDFDFNIQLYEKNYYQPIFSFMSMYYKNSTDKDSSTWGSKEKRLEGVMRLYLKWGNLLAFEHRPQNHILANANKKYKIYPRNKDGTFVKKFYQDIIATIDNKDYEAFEKIVFTHPDLVLSNKNQTKEQAFSPSSKASFSFGFQKSP